MKIGILIGHGKSDKGGYDSGAINKGLNLHEFKICKEIGKYCSDILKSYSCDVGLVNYAGDKNLLERIAYVNKGKFDLVIELHLNAHTSTSANGTECYYYPGDKQGDVMAIALCNNISHDMDAVNRKATASDYYGIIRQTNCTALLLECLFISNNEVKKVIDEKGQKAIAKSIVNAIVECYKLKFAGLKVGDKVKVKTGHYIKSIEKDGKVVIETETGKCRYVVSGVDRLVRDE